ncbi:hypothetical protein SDC9_108090 [bioreactor metagenome]|uniref:Uncharacterized protein n=1 Tax=bioreactor metagenome TaxID=1076179 RepID=A0A645BDH5_9ZZZZ
MYPIDVYRARRGGIQTGYDGKQGGFAAAAGPHHADVLPLGDLEAQVPDGFNFSVMGLIGHAHPVYL